jgi:hypothetical protein
MPKQKGLTRRPVSPSRKRSLMLGNEARDVPAGERPARLRREPREDMQEATAVPLVVPTKQGSPSQGAVSRFHFTGALVATRQRSSS